MSQVSQIISLLLCAVLLPPSSVGLAESPSSNPRGMLFSGGLGDPLPMNGNNPNIVIWISGIEAEKIFRHLENQRVSKSHVNRDPLQQCIDTSEGPTKVLSRGNGAVRCELSGQGEYSCALGADLGKGQSKLGLIC